VHILKSDAKTGLVHVTCQTCGHTLLAYLERQTGGVSCVGLVTDLSLSDTKRFLQRPSLTTEDVLLAHKSLTSAHFMDTVLRPRCS